MFFILKWILLLSLAVWIGYHRHWLSNLTRSRTSGSQNITSSFVDITDEYIFYNRSEQDQNAYLEFQYTIFRNGLCGQLNIPPLKRICTPYLHIHPYQLEKFVLQQGQLSYQLGDKIHTCNIHTCLSPIVVPPFIPHTFWMSDNKEDLILTVRIEPIYKDHGLRQSSYENIAGVRRDQYMTLWQAFIFVNNIETYPIVLPIWLTKSLFQIGSFIGNILGYQVEYDEYTTRIMKN